MIPSFGQHPKISVYVVAVLLVEVEVGIYPEGNQHDGQNCKQSENEPYPLPALWHVLLPLNRTAYRDRLPLPLGRSHVREVLSEMDATVLTI